MSDDLTPQQIAGRLTAALATIRDLWADHDRPTYGATGPQNGSGELGRLERVAHLGRIVRDDLYAWARIVMDECPPEMSPPRGDDVEGLCRYVIAAIEPFSARDEAWDDLARAEHHAAALRALVWGSTPTEMALCACPLTDCPGGTVRATHLRTEDGVALARCDGCHEMLTVSQWQEFAGIEDLQPMTKEDLIGFARREFGITLSDSGIKMLVGRGKLTPIDRERRPQKFDVAQCVEYFCARLQKC